MEGKQNKIRWRGQQKAGQARLFEPLGNLDFIEKLLEDIPHTFKVSDNEKIIRRCSWTALTIM